MSLVRTFLWFICVKCVDKEKVLFNVFSHVFSLWFLQLHLCLRKMVVVVLIVKTIYFYIFFLSDKNWKCWISLLLLLFHWRRRNLTYVTFFIQIINMFVGIYHNIIWIDVYFIPFQAFLTRMFCRILTMPVRHRFVFKYNKIKINNLKTKLKIINAFQVEFLFECFVSFEKFIIFYCFHTARIISVQINRHKYFSCCSLICFGYLLKFTFIGRALTHSLPILNFINSLRLPIYILSVIV